MDTIIIKFNNPEAEKKCLDSVKEFSSKGNKITVHDNYPQNENLGKLWNRLIRESQSEIIILLNNDTVVEKGWERFIEPLTSKEVGAVGPITNNCQTYQKELERGEGIIETNNLSGFCIAFRRGVWNEVGGFPEDAPFYGQETAFLELIKKRGYKLMIDTRVYIEHEGSSSVKKSGMDEESERQKGAKWFKDFLNKL